MRLPIARVLAAAVCAAVLPACASVTPRPDQPHILDSLAFNFPIPGCESVEIDLEILQPPTGVSKRVVTRVTSGHSVSMGNGQDFDLRERIKIVATVRHIAGNCPPLEEGKSYEFNDVMERKADGSYEADTKKFKLIGQPR